MTLALNIRSLSYILSVIGFRVFCHGLGLRCFEEPLNELPTSPEQEGCGFLEVSRFLRLPNAVAFFMVIEDHATYSMARVAAVFTDTLKTQEIPLI